MKLPPFIGTAFNQFLVGICPWRRGPPITTLPAPAHISPPPSARSGKAEPPCLHCFGLITRSHVAPSSRPSPRRRSLPELAPRQQNRPHPSYSRSTTSYFACPPIHHPSTSGRVTVRGKEGRRGRETLLLYFFMNTVCHTTNLKSIGDVFAHWQRISVSDKMATLKTASHFITEKQRLLFSLSRQRRVATQPPWHDEAPSRLTGAIFHCQLLLLSCNAHPLGRRVSVSLN